MLCFLVHCLFSLVSPIDWIRVLANKPIISVRYGIIGPVYFVSFIFEPDLDLIQIQFGGFEVGLNSLKVCAHLGLVSANAKRLYELAECC